MTITYGEMRTKEQVGIDQKIKEAVEAGIVMLQRKHGEDWVEKIDLETLQLSSANSCVLGQIYGSYDKGCAEFFDMPLEQGHEWSWEHPLTKKALAHGFVIQGGMLNYAPLNREWRRRIAEIKEKLAEV